MKFKDIRTYAYYSFCGIKEDDSLYVLDRHPGYLPYTDPRIKMDQYMHIYNSNMLTFAVKLNGQLETFSTINSNTLSQDYIDTISNTPTSGGFKSVIGMGSVLGIGLKNDGSIVPWIGNNDYEISYPEYYDVYNTLLNNSNKYLKIETDNQYNIVGIKLDGSLDNIYGHSNTNLPQGTDFIDIKIGYDGGGVVGIALKSNGDLISWGSTEFTSVVPSNKFKNIQCNEAIFSGITIDNGIEIWRKGNTIKYTYPNDSNYKKISAYNNYGIALRLDGTIIKFGNPDKYSIDLFTDIPGDIYPGNTIQSRVLPNGFNKMPSVVNNDGTGHIWGGDSHNDNIGIQSYVSNYNNISQIASTYEGVIMLLSDGTLVGTSGNKPGHTIDYNNLPDDDYYTSIVSGPVSGHVVALSSHGTVAKIGHEGSYKFPPYNDYVYVYPYGGIRKNGDIIITKSGSQGDHYTIYSNNCIYVTDILSDSDDSITEYGLHESLLALGSDGIVSMWDVTLDEQEYETELIYTKITDNRNPFINGLYKKIAVAGPVILAINNNNEIEAHFVSTQLEYGYQHTTDYYQNTIIDNIPTGNNFIDISASENNVMALRDTGEIEIWGDDSYNQISNAPWNIVNIMPPEISVNDTSFTTHIDPITIDITTSNPNGDKYKIIRTLTRSDGIEVFNKSTEFELSHPVIQEVLTPRTITLPVERNKPMNYIMDIIVENEAGEIAIEEVSISIINNTPTLSVDSSNKGYIDINVSDIDKDQLIIEVITNHGEPNQKILETFTSMINTENNNFIYYFKPGDLVIGENNNIRVIVSDPFFEEVYKDIEIEGDYIGIIFYDENGIQYNDDLNNILKYIEFDTMSNGDISNPIKIKLINSTNSVLSSINISPESQKSNIEFSIDNITWDNSIELENIDIDYELDIWIRLNIINSYQPGEMIENIIINGIS